MKICFFGVGGVGGYFGALVSNKFKNEHEVYFIARGSHKDAICSNGLTLKKAGGEEIISIVPKLCTDTTENLPICDIIVLSVKGYDLEKATKDIAKIANENTIILPLLNGVDIYERIRKHLNIGVVLPSCVYVGTHIESPGIIYQKGGSCKISIGRDPMFPEFYPEQLLDILMESDIDYSWEDDVYVSIWSKYMFVAAFGLVTATYSKTIGEILADSELSKLTKSVMAEIEKITKKLEIPLSSDIVEKSFNKAKQFPFETKTSFQRDVEIKGKKNEFDLFGETLIRLGKKLNIQAPQTRYIYEKFLETSKEKTGSSTTCL
ncbi:ketopantoate reductase family protein [Belliella sp. DSM 111904]|uniref:2-dehydropantoate 2-reductase n=1 Tax=Belliella filtrata TaxID=2923435 RepID=A0ABS9UXL6_9BACT|nr:2-dehydropantoate 2-reductase [Belliella filtrata]MCH7408926.1 ketopantoate reductase family protein [Belliella filtrata]